MMKSALLSLLVAGTALTAAPALADDAASIAENLFSEPQVVTDLPKPWPLKNLVNAGKLTIGTTGASHPRTYVDPATGKLAGSYVELFSKLAEDLGLEPEFVQLEWAGILPGLTANRFDIACDGGSWTAERLGSDQFLMTAPTAVNATVGLTLKDSGIDSFADLGDDKVLGGVRGEVYFEGAVKAYPDAESIDFPGYQESLLGLANGQADVVATHLSNALNALETAPNKDQLKIVGPAVQTFAQGLCINPREADLLVAVNTLLGNYRADGTLQAIIGKHAPNSFEVQGLKAIGY